MKADRIVRASVWLGLAIGGCHSNECDERRHAFELEPQGPGTAAVHVFGSTPSKYQYVVARWLGTAVNRSAEPCRIAFYEHASAPVAESVPVLERDAAAPATTADGGQLDLESLLVGARPGQQLVRNLDGWYLEPDDDPDLEHIDVWLTIATCDEPQVDVTLEVIGEVCFGHERPKGDVKAEEWWPDPPAP